MIRSLTIIENKDEKGINKYQLSGNLPLDECARALVIIAFNAEKPKKEEIISDPENVKSDK